MSELKERLTFYISAVLYFLFHLRVGADAMATAQATGLQILKTAPYVAGVTYVLIALLQYMAGGKAMPWERRIRLFFVLGIMSGLLYGIYEYAGVNVAQ